MKSTLEMFSSVRPRDARLTCERSARATLNFLDPLLIRAPFIHGGVEIFVRETFFGRHDLHHITT